MICFLFGHAWYETLIREGWGCVAAIKCARCGKVPAKPLGDARECRLMPGAYPASPREVMSEPDDESIDEAARIDAVMALRASDDPGERFIGELCDVESLPFLALMRRAKETP